MVSASTAPILRAESLAPGNVVVTWPVKIRQIGQIGQIGRIGRMGSEPRRIWSLRRRVDKMVGLDFR